MEPASEMEPQSVTAAPVREAGYGGLPAETDTYGVLLSPVGQMASFVLPDGGSTVLTTLPRSELKPGMVETLSALVDAAVEQPAAGAHLEQPAAGAEHCLVCNAQQSGERYALFDGSLYTTTSRRPVLGTLEVAVETALDPLAAHSQVICSACYDLADRLDQLQEELRQARDAVHRLYWQTAGLYPPSPPHPPPPPPQQQEQQPQQQQEQQPPPPPQQQQQQQQEQQPQPPPPPPPPQQQQQQQQEEGQQQERRVERRRSQRAATQHGPGHYRSLAEGQLPGSPPPPPPEGPADPAAHCNELDIDIHVEKARSKKAAVKREDRLSCRYCSKTFQRPARLRQHEAAHTQQTTANQCHLCTKTFSQKYYLREHVKQVHERRSLHSCDQCGKVFMRRLHLDDHVRTHNGERPYTCDVCGRGFSQRGNLRTHAMVHTDQFPYQCDSCGKRLRTRQAFEAHQRKHNDDRRFACDVCSASFLLKRSLERHQRKHTGDRPFKCSHCDRAFRDRGDLRCHEGIHSSERAHVCPLCGQGFTRRYKMQTHLRSKHDRSEHQVQELCLLQQTAHHMLQTQQKLEPLTVLETEQSEQQQPPVATGGQSPLLILPTSSPLPTN